MVNNSLQLVNFIDSEGNPTSGLVSTRKTTATNLTIDEQAAVFQAKTFKHVDYVFFAVFQRGDHLKY